MTEVFSSIDLITLQEPDTYVTVISQELSKCLAFMSVVNAFHVLVAIPLNIFTLWVIAKTKSLWTSSNTVLFINGFCMLVGSAMMLVLRQSNFPLFLFDENQRKTAFLLAWWVYGLTMRVGNNR